MSALAREGRGGLLAMPDGNTLVHRRTIIALANRYRLPAIYWNRPFVDDGGLMSYAADNLDLWRRAAVYVDRILNGARPAGLPVQQPTKFELAINLNTAKARGFTLAKSLLATADEVIE